MTGNAVFSCEKNAFSCEKVPFLALATFPVGSLGARPEGANETEFRLDKLPKSAEHLR